MLRPKALVAPLLLFCLVANGKDKKNLLPLDVLKAHSVVVMVDPDAGAHHCRSQKQRQGGATDDRWHACEQRPPGNRPVYGFDNKIVFDSGCPGMGTNSYFPGKAAVGNYERVATRTLSSLCLIGDKSPSPSNDCVGLFSTVERRHLSEKPTYSDLSPMNFVAALEFDFRPFLLFT
jgi:hypothetical protein